MCNSLNKSEIGNLKQTMGALGSCTYLTRAKEVPSCTHFVVGTTTIDDPPHSYSYLAKSRNSKQQVSGMLYAAQKKMN